jgi:hypothetical protein
MMLPYSRATLLPEGEGGPALRAGSDEGVRAVAIWREPRSVGSPSPLPFGDTLSLRERANFTA